MKRFGGQTMTADLKRVAVCPPAAAGWGDALRADAWGSLGYFHRPELSVADNQHRRLVEILGRAGVEVISLPEGEGLSLDAVYTHDASLVTDHGAICLQMGKGARAGEPARHRELYQSLDIPILGIMEPPATAEAGDIVWLDETTLLVGRGYRTNDSGIETLREWLGPKGVDVIAAPLPYGPGPSACLHLMSLMSLLDERTILVESSMALGADGRAAARTPLQTHRDRDVGTRHHGLQCFSPGLAKTSRARREHEDECSITGARIQGRDVSELGDLSKRKRRPDVPNAPHLARWGLAHYSLVRPTKPQETLDGCRNDALQPESRGDFFVVQHHPVIFSAALRQFGHPHGIPTKLDRIAGA